MWLANSNFTSNKFRTLIEIRTTEANVKFPIQGSRDNMSVIIIGLNQYPKQNLEKIKLDNDLNAKIEKKLKGMDTILIIYRGVW